MKLHLLAILSLAWLLTACGQKGPIISIHTAVEHNDLQTVQKHIAAKTDLNAKNSAGYTALHLAAMKGYAPIVEALLAAGADPTRKGPQGKTPLDVAREKGQNAIVQLLETKPGRGGRGLIDGGLGVSEAMDAF